MSLKILFDRNYQTADHLLCLIKTPNWRLKVILQKINRYKEVQNHSREILLCFCFIQQFLNYIIYWKYRLILHCSFVVFTDSDPRWLYILYNEFKDLLRITKQLPNGEMNCSKKILLKIKVCCYCFFWSYIVLNLSNLHFEPFILLIILLLIFKVG